MMKRLTCLLMLVSVGALAPGSADSWTQLETIENAERKLGAATAAVLDFNHKAKAGEDVVEELAAAKLRLHKAMRMWNRITKGTSSVSSEISSVDISDTSSDRGNAPGDAEDYTEDAGAGLDAALGGMGVASYAPWDGNDATLDDYIALVKTLNPDMTEEMLQIKYMTDAVKDYALNDMSSTGGLSNCVDQMVVVFHGLNTGQRARLYDATAKSAISTMNDYLQKKGIGWVLLKTIINLRYNPDSIRAATVQPFLIQEIYRTKNAGMNDEELLVKYVSDVILDFAANKMPNVLKEKGAVGERVFTFVKNVLDADSQAKSAFYTNLSRSMIDSLSLAGAMCVLPVEAYIREHIDEDQMFNFLFDNLQDVMNKHEESVRRCSLSGRVKELAAAISTGLQEGRYVEEMECLSSGFRDPMIRYLQSRR